MKCVKVCKQKDGEYQNGRMDLRNHEDEAEMETPADAGCCQACQRRACVAVTMATTILVMALVLCLAFLVTWTAAPEEDQTSDSSGKDLMKRLQHCQVERQRLDLMLHAVTRDSRCSLCPVSWLWWRSHCYFFSVGVQENRQWNKSAKFCQQHNSSLAVIKDSAEMEFIQGEMRKFLHFPFLWVGLTDAEQEGRWLWWDGSDIQRYMPLAVQWDADHKDCADLRGNGTLFAASCDDYGPWVCKKDI